MPLPAPPEREHLHTRTITCQGYQRDDGLWDIEGWITDVKSYEFSSIERGDLRPGVPVHGMGLRLTVDAAKTIREVEAVMDFAPFGMCPNITPNFQKLVGLNLDRGFDTAVRDVLGGVQGCTHLVELLRPIAATAHEAMAPIGS